MAKWRITFKAYVSRVVEVPDNLNYSEAYNHLKPDFYQIAHSAAAQVQIKTDHVEFFERLRDE